MTLRSHPILPPIHPAQKTLVFGTVGKPRSPCHGGVVGCSGTDLDKLNKYEQTDLQQNKHEQTDLQQAQEMDCPFFIYLSKGLIVLHHCFRSLRFLVEPPSKNMLATPPGKHTKNY